jgi:hypothetical protein
LRAPSVTSTRTTVRFCDRCRKNVYNVATMLPGEALALIRRNERGVCLQLTRRRDGTLVTGDCCARLRQARRKGILVLIVMLPFVLAAQLGAQAFGLRTLWSVLVGEPPTDGFPGRGGEVQVRGLVGPPDGYRQP